MPTERKIEIVEELRDRIERSVIAIATEYRGLNATEMVKLRKAMHEAGVEMRVVKNRLLLRAAEAAKHPEFAELLDGPTAIVFGYEDISSPAKAVTEYARQAKNAFAVRNGVLDGRVVSASEIQEIGALPPREVMVAQIAGALISPVANLAGLLNRILTNPAGLLLNDSLRTFSGLVKAREEQIEGA